MIQVLIYLTFMCLIVFMPYVILATLFGHGVAILAHIVFAIWLL